MRDARRTPLISTPLFLAAVALLFLALPALAAFKVSGEVVKDTATGLVWMQTDNGTATWQAALAQCETSTHDGRSDWRLPSRNELLSLLDFSRSSPCLDPVFHQTFPHTYFWSSSPYVNDPTKAWTVDFAFGTSTMTTKTEARTVRCVRGGP